MANRFKDPRRKEMYDTMMALANDRNSELYVNGRPRRGASHRLYFWNGYLGAGLVPDGTMAYVCHRAGQDFRKTTDEYVDDAGYKRFMA